MNRADAEAVLIRRCGAVLMAVGLDGTTVTGANADLNDPLWFSLQRLGYGIISISLVADADVEAVALDDQAPFLDIAELRTLDTALNAATGLVDITVGPRRESLSQLAARLEKTVASGHATYWSRSRKKLWAKGETSGHVQTVREILLDCDGDSLVLLVEQTGPACHTGERTCFYRTLAGTSDSPGSGCGGCPGGCGG